MANSNLKESKLYKLCRDIHIETVSHIRGLSSLKAVSYQEICNKYRQENTSEKDKDSVVFLITNGITNNLFSMKNQQGVNTAVYIDKLYNDVSSKAENISVVSDLTESILLVLEHCCSPIVWRAANNLSLVNDASEEYRSFLGVIQDLTNVILDYPQQCNLIIEYGNLLGDSDEMELRILQAV